MLNLSYRQSNRPPDDDLRRFCLFTGDPDGAIRLTSPVSHMHRESGGIPSRIFRPIVLQSEIRIIGKRAVLLQLSTTGSMTKLPGGGKMQEQQKTTDDRKGRKRIWQRQQ